METLSRKVQCTCPTCGKSFEKYPSMLVGKNQVYCSKPCKHKGMQSQTIVPCIGCGKLVSKFACELKANKTAYCTRQCYNDNRRKEAKPSTYLKDSGRHQHRIIAERILGRPLLRREVVHHIDENKHNNAPENLAVLPNQRLHAKVHFSPDSIDLEPYVLLNLSNGNL